MELQSQEQLPLSTLSPLLPGNPTPPSFPDTVTVPILKRRKLRHREGSTDYEEVAHLDSQEHRLQPPHPSQSRPRLASHSQLPHTSQETQCHSPSQTKGLFFIVPVKLNQKSWLGLILCPQSHSGPASLGEEREGLDPSRSVLGSESIQGKWSRNARRARWKASGLWR